MAQQRPRPRGWRGTEAPRGGTHALVLDQVGLSNFWSDWQQQQRQFLSSTTVIRCKGPKGAAASAGSKPRTEGVAQEDEGEGTDLDGPDGSIDTAEELAALLMTSGVEERGMADGVDLEAAPLSPLSRPVATQDEDTAEIDDSAGSEDNNSTASLPSQQEGSSSSSRAGGPERAGGPSSSRGDGRSSARRRRPRAEGGIMPSSPSLGGEDGVDRDLGGNGGQHQQEEEDDERVLLRQKIAELEGRLVETEAFMSTEPGALIQDLESDLAKTRLKLAHAEAERDELEVQVMNLRSKAANKGKENGSPKGLRWLSAQARV